MKKLFLMSVAVLMLAGCGDEAAETPQAVAVPATNPALEGQWKGPGDTSATITNMGGFYELQTKDKAGVKMYPAQVENGNLVFTRDGTKETIKPGDGAATGVKDLADKKNCIVVKTGEGYCKD